MHHPVEAPVMSETNHQSFSQLESQLDEIRGAPADQGTVRVIVCRPSVGERKVVVAGELNLERGLVGDTWLERTADSRHDAATDLEMQLTIMNARAIAHIAQSDD